jgi:GTP-binding protein
VNNSWHLVDLPGYGYAKVSKAERANFLTIIYNYLLNRKSLICLFLLIDSRHKPQANDLEFMRWLGENKVPFVICFTKTDKLSSSQINKTIQIYKQTLLKEWESLPQIFYTSTTSNRGKEEILNFIEATNQTLE